MKEQATDITLADLRKWNEQQLAAAKATPDHADVTMHNLRMNVIEVAQQSLDRCNYAIEGHGLGYKVKNWMMETFGMPQMVTLRDADGTVYGTFPAIEVLNAKPQEPEPVKG